jgi:hypothetical protein
MNAREMGRKGGSRTSPAKRAAARLNGARGGRPREAERFAREVRSACERLAPRVPHIDATDLRRIVRNLLLPAAKRCVFVYRRKDGRYVF